MLLSGILLDINGVILDIGFPGLLTLRNERQRSKTWRQLMHGRVTSMRRAKLPRTKPLPNEWWRKRPKPYEMEGRVLERLIGPAAYRGMTRIRLQDVSPNDGLVQQRKQQRNREQQGRHSHGVGSSNYGQGDRGAPRVQQRGDGTRGGEGQPGARRGSSVTSSNPRNPGVTVRQRKKR